MKFLTGAAQKFHFNGKEFALMGGSAGAYMAMLYAYGYDVNRQVKTVVDLWGPTDLTDASVRTPDSDATVYPLIYWEILMLRQRSVLRQALFTASLKHRLCQLCSFMEELIRWYRWARPIRCIKTGIP